ncbi:pyrroline-5-carboxylate reductase [Acetivibrio saccincola]|jgi:pyrroline-5-carboxylate reductase|uniref:Pyrroline-5-carboxylate reductase n=1 Tax=Acetivibrio saccincola TaxID=1677857 RepID=A0A2K9E250_9FIRM|nr:pyrroline-5-carboxylate reductase [Acetivibrio saccincola]AUG57837.1 Pyrroline-5-carboxylate reductase [Acetivibrio saccincola]NLW26771.1 pyrroline-5-carboxylate reductase [Acetivibrio saccincola]PQQ67720.1 pyrroline-5-carboxylate reductase [Acetivibrio saccincola]HQD29326.1 pyrroline-5-carboxylate reductase [Acetivibrio saccincola]
MDLKVGFIGAGNMGCAMIKSIVNSKFIKKEDIFVYDIDKGKLSNLKSETGVTILNDSGGVIEKSDIIILAVKPNMVKNVLEANKDAFDDKKILVSVAVGIPIKFYQDIIGNDKKIVRTMPNTPALVGEGMTLMCYDENILSGEEFSKVKKIFECFGKVEVLDEKLMNEVTAVTGSSPAYVFMFIEAMADAAVLSGLPRDLSYKLAAQAVLGSAKLVLETGKHPGELKDQVCSPAGTTIEAVKTLEKHGFRYAIIDAMEECTKKARKIGKG